MGKKQKNKNFISANVSYKNRKWTNEIRYTRDLSGGYFSTSLIKEGRNPLAHEYRLTKNFDGGNIFASAIKQGGEPWRQRIRFNKDFGEKSSGYIGISRCSGNPKSTTFEFGFNTEF